mmetsp:Transcript_23492/g.66871  ORF Transcript_23492/g.66871 Transcript_23492/m.66871 type:complete len:452 (-) Transcript_23492:3429-4784(-)
MDIVHVPHLPTQQFAQLPSRREPSQVHGLHPDDAPAAEGLVQPVEVAKAEHLPDAHKDRGRRLVQGGSEELRVAGAEAEVAAEAPPGVVPHGVLKIHVDAQLVAQVHQRLQAALQQDVEQPSHVVHRKVPGEPNPILERQSELLLQHDRNAAAELGLDIDVEPAADPQDHVPVHLLRLLHLAGEVALAHKLGPFAADRQKHVAQFEAIRVCFDGSRRTPIVVQDVYDRRAVPNEAQIAGINALLSELRMRNLKEEGLGLHGCELLPQFEVEAPSQQRVGEVVELFWTERLDEAIDALQIQAQQVLEECVEEAHADAGALRLQLVAEHLHPLRGSLLWHEDLLEGLVDAPLHARDLLYEDRHLLKRDIVGFDCFGQIHLDDLGLGDLGDGDATLHDTGADYGDPREEAVHVFLALLHAVLGEGPDERVVEDGLQELHCVRERGGQRLDSLLL